MKNIFSKITALLLVLVFLLCGCSKDKKTEPTKEVATETLRIDSAEYTEENVKITHPVFSGPQEEIIEGLNFAILQNVKEKVAVIKGRNAEKAVAIEATYETTFKSDKIASFLYKGTTKIGKEESLFLGGFTVTIEKGRKFEISEIITFDDTFPENVKKGKITNIDGVDSLEAKEILEETDNLEIIDGIRIESAKYSFYLKDNSLIVIFPVTHELGDYALSEIELK